MKRPSCEGDLGCCWIRHDAITDRIRVWAMREPQIGSMKFLLAMAGLMLIDIRVFGDPAPRRAMVVSSSFAVALAHCKHEPSL